MSYIVKSGPGSSVGIATELRAGRCGIESRWGRDFPPVQTGPGAHLASCKMGTGSFPGVKYGRGVLLTTHPLLVPRSRKSRTIPLPTLWATTGLQRENFTFYIMKNTFSSFLSVTWSKCSHRTTYRRKHITAAVMTSCYVIVNRLIHKQFKYK